jgi:hypothetical protein
MDLDRAQIKAQLMQERKQMRLIGGKLAYVLMCDVCGKLGPTDLHESLISRGRARGDDELERLVLLGKCNLNLLCNHCNVKRAEMEKHRRRLVLLNLDRYGLEAMTAWVRGLPITAESIRMEYVNLLEDVWKEAGPVQRHLVNGRQRDLTGTMKPLL